jgi:hypothetical protein
MHELIAKAREVLAMAPRRAAKVLSVRGNFQAVIDLLFSRMRTATSAVIEAALRVNANISKAHEASVFRG